MVGASFSDDAIAAMLPPATAEIFQQIFPRVRPDPVLRWGARIAGRLLMKRAVGKPREAVPVWE